MCATKHKRALSPVDTDRPAPDQTGLPSVDALPDRGHLSRQYAELLDIAARLIKECSRLQADNDDLRASARLWMRMHEQQVERANSFEHQLLEGARRV
ncbi:hypothetical protein BH23ACI1_BH23ACI1_19910 [soil metagenome]